MRHKTPKIEKKCIIVKIGDVENRILEQEAKLEKKWGHYR